MSKNIQNEQNPTEQNLSGVQDGAAPDANQFGQRLELNIYKILELLQKGVKESQSDGLNPTGQPLADIVQANDGSTDIQAKHDQSKIDVRIPTAFAQTQMKESTQNYMQQEVKTVLETPVPRVGQSFNPVPQSTEHPIQGTQYSQFNKFLIGQQLGQKMTRFPTQNSNEKIVLLNKSIQQNKLNQQDSVQNNKGGIMQMPLMSQMQIPQQNIIQEANPEGPKSRTETVCSNNSSCTNQKTQILTVSSVPPNGHSNNTVGPMCTSSAGFRTETVQSSLLEKGEQQDTQLQKNAKLGTELAKQLTEGKIDFTQFVQQFQHLIPNDTNQVVNQKMTYKIPINQNRPETQFQIKQAAECKKQQIIQQMSGQTETPQSGQDIKKPMFEDKRPQSNMPMSRNNGAIMDKMHNQMFFEDLFPQINSLQKKPNNQQLINEVVTRHNRSQRSISQLPEPVTQQQASTSSTILPQSQSRRYIEQFQNQNQQGNKSKDSRQSKQSNKSNRSRQSRNSEGQHSSSLQRFQLQRPRKAFENDSQSHDEVQASEKYKVNVTAWKPQFQKRQNQEDSQVQAVEGSNDLQGVIMSLLIQKIKQSIQLHQQPEMVTSSSSQPLKQATDIQEMILTQLKEKAELLNKVDTTEIKNHEQLTANFGQKQFLPQKSSQLHTDEQIGQIDLNNFPALPQEIKDIILQKQMQQKQDAAINKNFNVNGNNQGSSTDNEDKSNGLDFKKLHDLIENYIPPKSESEAPQPQGPQDQILQRIRNLVPQQQQPILPMRYNGPTSSSSGEDKQQWQKQEIGQGLMNIQDQLKQFIGQQTLQTLINQNSVLGKRNMSERTQHGNEELIHKIVMAQKPDGSERDEIDEQDDEGQYCDDDYDTPMMIRLRNQVRKNQSRMQFRQIKNELLKAIQYEKNELKYIIDAKPKRPHHNMGTDLFRGSKFRGVSRNKNKWQMMIMINQKKVYVGAIASENDAAKYYDSIAIICQGLSAKTNFNYDSKKIKQILSEYDVYSDAPNSNTPTLEPKKIESIDDEEQTIDKQMLEGQSQMNMFEGMPSNEQLVKMKLKNITPESWKIIQDHVVQNKDEDGYKIQKTAQENQSEK